MKYKVVIIGNDHVNTLGVVRTFGENGINPYLILINDIKKAAVIKSKYVKKYWICENDNIAIMTLISEFVNEKNKVVVIPTSDSIASFLDYSYEKLSKKFIIPNILEKSCGINEYMDKYKQYEIAKKNGIKMAESIVINPNNLGNIDKIKYPCIVKPLVSAEGNKEDIFICFSEVEFLKKISVPSIKKYPKLLVQEYLTFDYECDVAGFTYKNKTSISRLIEKIRIWPEKKGSTTYGKVVSCNKYDNMIKEIKKLMNNIGYNGIFDIDIFIKGNEYYLNEINFRNGALSYAYGDANICYYWYLSNLIKKFVESPLIKDSYYFIDDHADIHNIKDKIISYKIYKRDKNKSLIKLVKNSYDKKPSKYMFMYKILNKLKMKKLIYLFERIVHFRDETYILKANQDTIVKNKFNQDYNVKIINDNNNIYSILFEKDNEIIGNGTIKCKGSKDEWLKIKNNNTYIISSIYVEPKYRGKNYQCDIILELINRFVKSDKFNIYSVVYKYNIPSYRNLEKLGFKIYKVTRILRIMKKTINKTRV